ncbi:hypothetical protein PTSG_02769 [Salpingoeca rosetta]|uniref:Uncharacterized protein n=1 Tax=Salpingoeca rosetta (strain ATCC 50818 / BSB-021) TaxID=946362 RepID=F2U395_SALR5|nr:uncharacterized protein PTSG_02769 [Salpingoeca rosetta]EGD82089.1 hypothetical protein PTSG_02769 [Salpingoeca rosetta]|eukprot:XP_004996272.1 hypothetical protein PTSG_02769 [Salpingoeca rosetta]
MSVQQSSVAPLQIPAQQSQSRLQTGYASNTRPVIVYNPEVDDDDGLRNLCSPQLHFSTRTARDYDKAHGSVLDETERTMHPKTWGTQGAEYAAAHYASARAAATRSSGYRAQIQHTLPKSKEVDPPSTLTTEARQSFRPAQLYPEHKVPGTAAGARATHAARSSAFTNNLQTSAFEPSLEPLEKATETRSRFAQSPKKEFRLPPIVKQPSQYEYGYRPRPFFLPPRSDQVYGEPVKKDVPTTARLARSDPTEYFNRTNTRSNATWTQTNFGNKHQEAMDEGHRMLYGNKHLLQDTRVKKSGFVRNVDIFSVEPDDEKERFRTTTRMSYAARP